MMPEKTNCGITPDRRRDRLLIVVAAISICIAGYTARFMRAGAADAVVVKMPMQVHNFGTMLPNSKYSTTFLTTNNLSDVLVIDRIARSCGCTTAVCNHITVLRGQTFAIDAVMSDQDYPESMTSFISVYAHAGEQQIEAKYQLEGDVENVIEFPESAGGYLRLGDWPLSQLPAQTAVIVTRGNYPLDFDELRAECDSPVLSVTVKQVNHVAWRVQFHVNPSGVIGGTGFPVTFRFVRHGSVLPQTVVKQAFVNVRGPVTASPSSLLLAASVNQHIHETITISTVAPGPDSATLKITTVQSVSMSVVATWQNDAHQSIVNLDYAAPSQPGSDRGEIIVSVSDRGKTYKIKVSYLALIS